MGEKRHINRGVEKRCMCRRSSWSQCPHPWMFRYKPRGHGRQQLSLERLLGYHVDSRTDADKHANRTGEWLAAPLAPDDVRPHESTCVLMSSSCPMSCDSAIRLRRSVVQSWCKSAK